MYAHSFSAFLVCARCEQGVMRVSSQIMSCRQAQWPVFLLKGGEYKVDELRAPGKDGQKQEVQNERGTECESFFSPKSRT